MTDDRPSEPGRLDPAFAVLDCVHCGAAVVDAAGRILRVNDRLARMLNREAEAVADQTIDAVFADDSRDRVMRLIRANGAADGEEVEATLRRADDEPLPATAAVRAVPDGGAVADAGAGPLRIVTLIDISRLRGAHAHLAHLTDTVLNQAIELKHQNEDLEARVAERTAELHEANMQSIQMLAIASEARDADTGNHVQRINRYAHAVAEALGLCGERAERIGYSAVLHDVGKIEVPDEVLKKPGPLTAEERSRMQRHTLVGEQILSRAPFFETARQIARSHHENWDGSGYPDGAAGEAIPLPARIVHVVDVYDALMSPRVYKPAWEEGEALATIGAQRGRHFDPRVADVFLDLADAGRLADVRRSLPVVFFGDRAERA